MEVSILFPLFFLFSLSLQRVISEFQSQSAAVKYAATLPPRGWNSYDSFCWIVSEEEFLKNAELVAHRLHSYGYEYVVVDYLWYRKHVPGAYVDSLGFDVIDEWGRLVPDPERWPSSEGGKGFAQVSKTVHAMGLKFGIHVMRGISTQAYNANTPILDITTGKAYEESGRQWYAKDIGIKERTCAWMRNGFMSVNTKLGAGRAFLRSLYQQYADWGVDFVKNDCVFGDDLDMDEITFVSEVLSKLNRPILYSLSPGTSVTPNMAKDVIGLVNMYRITGDDWDTWGDVSAHFDVARDFASADMIGAMGLNGKSWPDLDMLPLGWLTDPGSDRGPYRNCKLNLDEQRTQMTLWSMAKSPLMFGGDVRNLDDTTFSLITNPTLLEINSFSSNNKEFPYIIGTKCSHLRSSLSCQTNKYEDKEAPEDVVLSLSSCQDANSNGWSTKALDDLEQVCWKENSRRKNREPFCLYKGKPLVASDEEMTCREECEAKLHLRATKTREFCLGASSNQRLTSKEYKRGAFSPCRLEANQMWELNNNGTLKSSYSGLCASVYNVKANSVSGGIRSWIATGRRGEIYLAFFNLNPQKTVISTKIPHLAKSLPGRALHHASCTCNELWSGRNFGVIKDTLSIEVEPHGCALFTLNCK
ncbi:hypothetical protein M9H77_27160 [Catharanthus roseus]|uniref:Uncharacterized protein n=1 Tax=Catharanthus roseus TaxID=4058 RepID=A0ACC0AEE6_CATRO|nr:hypothetical protein M9H77_27160 [Catharanthus roseus]